MRIKAGLLTLYNEIKLSLALSLHYKFNNLMRLAIMTLKFIGFSMFVFNGALDSPELPSMLLGYLVWFFSFFPLFDMGFHLREAMQEGTLEQIFMSPFPAWLIIIGRMMATFIVTIGQSVLMVLALRLMLGVHMPFNIHAMVIFLFIFIGITGLALMIGAITLLTKRTESLSMLCSNVMMFLSGTILPVERLPHALQWVAYCLPTTPGIIALRQAAVQEKTLYMLWMNGILVQHIFVSVLYFALGLGLFMWCTHIVKGRGTLGQY